MYTFCGRLRARRCLPLVGQNRVLQEAAAQLPNVAAYGDVVRRLRGSVLNVRFEAGSAFDWTMAERCRLGSIVAAVAPKRAL
jgi:hypothetical protein